MPGLRAADPIASDPQLGETYALSGRKLLYSVEPTGGLLSFRAADTASGRLVVDERPPRRLRAARRRRARGARGLRRHDVAHGRGDLRCTHLVAAGVVLDGRLWTVDAAAPPRRQLVPVSLLTSGLYPPVAVPAGVDTSSMAVDADHGTGWSFLGSAPGGPARSCGSGRWSAGWTRGRTITLGGASVVALRNTLWVTWQGGGRGVGRPALVLTRLEPSEISPDLGRGVRYPFRPRRPAGSAVLVVDAQRRGRRLVHRRPRPASVRQR